MTKLELAKGALDDLKKKLSNARNEAEEEKYRDLIQDQELRIKTIEEPARIIEAQKQLK